MEQEQKEKNKIIDKYDKYYRKIGFGEYMIDFSYINFITLKRLSEFVKKLANEDELQKIVVEKIGKK